MAFKRSWVRSPPSPPKRKCTSVEVLFLFGAPAAAGLSAPFGRSTRGREPAGPPTHAPLPKNAAEVYRPVAGYFYLFGAPAAADRAGPAARRSAPLRSADRSPHGSAFGNPRGIAATPLSLTPSLLFTLRFSPFAKSSAAPSTPIQNSLFTPKDVLRQMPFGLPQGDGGACHPGNAAGRLLGGAPCLSRGSMVSWGHHFVGGS